MSKSSKLKSSVVVVHPNGFYSYASSNKVKEWLMNGKGKWVIPGTKLQCGRFIEERYHSRRVFELLPLYVGAVSTHNELRGSKSGYAGPTVMQVVPLRDKRKVGKR